MTTTTLTAHFFCKNASGSYCNIEASNVKDALNQAAKLFDAQCSFHLPITAEGDFGLDEYGYAQYTETGKLTRKNGKNVIEILIY